MRSLPIRTRGLTKQYGDLVAVDQLNLEVHAGEIFGLLGQNGAGKTTTILMLLGLTEPTDGEARVVGLDPARNPLEVKRRVGYMPDSVGFYTDLTGRENLRYTARLNRIPDDQAESTIDEVLEQVGLTERADDLTDTYSRGMLQRLGIADALVKDPDVLILDEPTTAIDPLGVVEILDLLRRLVRRARPGGSPVEPPAQPGPVSLRPGRDLRGGPAGRPGHARGARPRASVARRTVTSRSPSTRTSTEGLAATGRGHDQGTSTVSADAEPGRGIRPIRGRVTLTSSSAAATLAVRRRHCPRSPSNTT